METVPIPGKQSSFKILQLLDTWRHQSLVILLFSSFVTLIYKESTGICLVYWHNPALARS